MANNQLNSVPPAKAFLMIRIIWGALLLGQFAFLAVESIILSQPGQQPAPPIDANILFVINIGMLVTIVPVMFMVRMKTFSRNRVNGVIPPAAYGTGNIIFWAGCEGVSFFGLVVAMLTRSFWPTILCVIAAMALQIVTFPRLSDIQAPGDTFKI